MAALGVLFCVASCKTDSGSKSPDAAKNSPFLQAFLVEGIVRELRPAEQTVVIQHETIPGYMEAMTMPFAVKRADELGGLHVGDTVSFKMIVTATDGWIEHIQVIKPAESASGDEIKNELPNSAPVRVVRDVEPLNVGDALPDYTFTNELGQAVNFQQFKGQVIAITFIFTRCPFPTFCPKMSANFVEAQNKLKAQADLKDWHLFTISFDPEFDTPATLQAYAERYGYDPARWSFLTGTMLDTTAITEQCGVQFWRLNPNEPISHNLRTVVVSRDGKIFKMLADNLWTGDELVEAMKGAAAAAAN